METRDLIVVGGGSGGVRAARLAAQSGAKTLLFESGALGGTCVNVGCVPKKLFARAAGFADAVRAAASFGWKIESPPPFDWPLLRENKNREIARLNAAYEKTLAAAGVEIVKSRAVLDSENAVRDDGGKIHRARKILLATGSKPVRPDIPGAAAAAVSDDMFFLDSLPRRALVVGGGYIAVEFAGILANWGVRTTMLVRSKLLREFDDDLGQCAAESLAARGVKIINDSPAAIEEIDAGKRVILAGGGAVECDLVLFAVGRRANSDEINPAAAGIEPRADGFVAVDDDFRARGPVFALGDLLGRAMLTPVAIAEAKAFVARHFGGDARARVRYDAVATAVFGQIEIGAVGLSESQARANGARIRTHRARFRPLSKSLARSGSDDNGEKTLVKLVVDDATDRVLGAHIAGEAAAEIIQGIAIAVTAGLTKRAFDETIAVHPTIAEEFVTLD